MTSPGTPVQQDIRKLQKQVAKKNIEEHLLKLNFSHLTSNIILDLFNLEPAEVNYNLNELKLPFNKKSVAELLSCRALEFNLEELQNVDVSLQLYRTAFFSNRKSWTAINLLNPEDDLQCHADEKIIKLNILQAFRTKGHNAVVKVITHDEMIWIMIVGKKLTRRKGIKLETPVFICYEVGTPYIFVASSVPATVMECILKAMKYKNHKIQHLSGRNIKSLLTLLKNKAMNTNAVKQITYQPAEAEIGRRHVDFTKKKAREAYVKEIFQTKDPIYLEKFTVKVDAVWRENSVVPEMAGEHFVAHMELKSKNLINMVKQMAIDDMLATPVPEYIQTILCSGKNNISMRSAK